MQKSFLMQKVPPGQVDPTGVVVMGGEMDTLVEDTVFIEEEGLKGIYIHDEKA